MKESLYSDLTMNQTTEALVNAIEESKALHEIVLAHVRFAELCDDPHTALKHWLEEWIGDLIPAEEETIAVYFRQKVLKDIDFEVLAWYFLDDEFLEEN